MDIDNKELEQYNGKDGKPIYVAAKGKIYDVSESKLWKNGKHMNRHQAGQDLTSDFSAAPHGAEVLQKFNQVGKLKQTTDEQAQLPIPRWAAKFLDAYPFFKRHPHPMVVHFTMVYFITAPVLLLWYYLISPNKSLLDAIFYMHVLGTISLPVALFTGWLSWQVNYFGKSIGYITRKIILSITVLIFDFIVLASLIAQPDILVAAQGIQILVPVLIFSYLPIVSIIGHHGGQLVY